MKNFFCVITVFFCSLFMLAPRAMAAGFALPEQGTAAMGMGSAFVGQADDASAVWYNPAGITQLDGVRLMGGFVMIYPEFEHNYANDATDTSKRTFHFPAILYATGKLNDRVAFGVGVNNPFGLATNWQPTSATSQVAVLSKVLATEVNPVIAVKINDRFSLAAGIAYVYMRARMTSVYPGTSFISSLRGTGDGWGGNVSALVKISDAVSTGISYRSRVKIDLDGTAQITGAPSPPFPGPSDAKTSITLPDLLSWGVSVKPSDRLTLNLDLGYTWWSTYDKLVVNAANSAYNHTYEKQWNDVWNVRMGAQYRLADNWKLRAGLQYDKNPVPDHYFETRVPDSDRFGASMGLGYTYKNLTVDAAYLYLKFLTRNIGDSGQDNPPATTNGTALNGTYKADAHVIGFAFGYKF